DGAPRIEMRERLAAFFKQVPASVIAPPALGQSAPSQQSFAAPPAQPWQLNPPAPRQDFLPTPTPQPVPIAPELPTTDRPTQPAPKSDGQSLQAIQIHNSYLVVQSDDGVLIIDQHALHERIVYEELLARLNR